MAEQIHFSPGSENQRLYGESADELAKFEERIVEVNQLLDQVYATGLMRWLKDFVGAMPQISQIALDGINTPQGQAGMRNLLLLSQQLGRIDPEQLEQALAAANTGLVRARETAQGQHESAYDPPGVTGVFKLLHDKELWGVLAPVLEGVKAYSAEQKTATDKDEAPDK